LNDPLAQFRRNPEPESVRNQAQVPDEHRALRVAIDALHQIPDTPLSGEYNSTHALISVLETAYENAERELEQQRVSTPMMDLGVEAAVEHDVRLWKDGRQDGIQEPVSTPMTDAEIEKAAHAIQLLDEAARTHQRQDIEPEM
jgi:hypothetical protein